MRPFPQPLEHQVWKKLLALWVGVEVCLVGCGFGGCATVASKSSLPPPANQSIDVTVTPPSGAVLLGNQIAFSAAIANTSDTAVLWSVNGVAGGNAAWGMITGAGVYTAPADLPAPAMLRVTATSRADATKSASATVTVQSDVAVTLGTTVATVALGASRDFVAGVSSSGHPDKSLVWSLTGAPCPLECGSVDANGTYTAPQILPVPASVTLTARSVADPSKHASTAITVTSKFVLQLSVPATVPAGATATFVATLIPVPGSNPSTALTWSLSGSGCSGISCGSLSVVTTQSAGGSPTALSASYVAPALRQLLTRSW